MAKTVNVHGIPIECEEGGRTTAGQEAKFLSPRWWNRGDVGWLNVLTNLWVTRGAKRDPRWAGDFRAFQAHCGAAGKRGFSKLRAELEAN